MPDVSERTGSIKLNFPDREPGDMPAAESCCLDIADAGGANLELAGTLMNFTRERARQVEFRALRKLVNGAAESLREYAPEGPVVRRRLPVLVEDEEEEATEAAG